MARLNAAEVSIAGTRRLGFGHARRSLRGFVGPNYRAQLAGVAVLGAVIGLLEAAILRVIGELAGSAEAGGATLRSIGPFDGLTTGRLIAFGLIATGVLVVLRAGETATVAKIGVQPLTASRSRLAASFLHADYAAQQDLTAGDYHELVLSHTRRVSSISTATARLVSALFITLALSVAAAIVSWQAFVVLAGVMCIVMAFTTPISSLAHRLGKTHVVANAALASSSAETVDSATEVRLLGVADEVMAVTDDRIERVSDLIFKNNAVAFFAPAFFQALMLGVIVVGAGVIASLESGSLAQAGSVALIALRAQMAGRQALTANLSIAASAPFADELNDRLTALTPQPGGGDETLEAIETVELAGVSFTHAGNDNEAGGAAVLRSLDLAVGRGERVGIVGPSGSGKTTLLTVLVGLVEPDSGTVTINGVERSQYDPTSLIGHIATVAQRPRLITATVAENIRFFRSGLSDDDVCRAAQAAGIHDEIMQWSDGYDTEIGERGRRQVSGGQAQRICIARALAGSPSLLIMDEPTSSIDELAEQVILDTLEGLDRSCAAVIVSHRPSALASCDRVLVFENGRLRPTMDEDQSGSATNNDTIEPSTARGSQFE